MKLHIAFLLLFMGGGSPSHPIICLCPNHPGRWRRRHRNILSHVHARPGIRIKYGLRVSPPKHSSSNSTNNNIFFWQQQHALLFHLRTISHRRSWKILSLPPLPPCTRDLWYNLRSKASDTNLWRTSVGGQGGYVFGEDCPTSLRCGEMFVHVAPGECGGRRVHSYFVLLFRGC